MCLRGDKCTHVDGFYGGDEMILSNTPSQELIGAQKLVTRSEIFSKYVCSFLTNHIVQVKGAFLKQCSLSVDAHNAFESSCAGNEGVI